MACSPDQRFLPSPITNETAAGLHCLVKLGKRNLSLQPASMMIWLYDLLVKWRSVFSYSLLINQNHMLLVYIIQHAKIKMECATFLVPQAG